MYEKNVFCYILCGILKQATLRSEEIYHYGRLSDQNFLSIGFHESCHFFRFQEIANIPSYVFHTFCLIYPTLSDKKFLSIGFNMTHIFSDFKE